MDSAKNQLIEKLQASTNILVTVSSGPSVDQLAACVGLTLLLNKSGKHATAVFSGEVPSTLEFLQPEQTLEKTTDSLRDFIIALDKSKADKLRYKVEDEMVRIFITPFRVSLSDKDLEFSQGDFNVDAVVALGVSKQEDFDTAITAHGRILHDATIIGISTQSGAELGSINWSEPGASSLSELIVALAHGMGDSLLDSQVATALLTGIVSETERFSNGKTTPQTMSISAELMAAGANQQLVASKLEVSAPAPAADSPMTTNSEAAVQTSTEAPARSVDGTLEIDHDSIGAVLDELAASEPAEPLVDEPAAELPPPVDEVIPPSQVTAEAPALPPSASKSSRLIVEPPTLGGQLTANSQPESLDRADDPLAAPTTEPPALLNRPSPEPAIPVPPVPKPAAPKYEPLLTGFTPPPPSWRAATQDGSNQLNDPQQPAPLDNGDKTLAELEVAVNSPHVESVDSARDEVLKALNSQPGAPEPMQSMGAQPLGDPLRPANSLEAAVNPVPSFSDVLNQVIPSGSGASTLPVPPVAEAPTVFDPSAPPPVPPPIPFNFSAPPTPPQ